MSGGNRDYADRATAHYKEALRLIEAQAGDDSQAANAVRYMLGKHALNAEIAYANPGEYSRSWEKIAPEPRPMSILRSPRIY